MDINQWLHVSQETGTPNTDGVELEVTADRYMLISEDKRTGTFEIVGGVLSGTSVTEGLKVGVNVSQYKPHVLDGNLTVGFFNSSGSDMNYIDGIVSVKTLINSIDVSGQYIDTGFSGEYILSIRDNWDQILDYSNNSLDIDITITIDIQKLKSSGYNMIRVYSEPSVGILINAGEDSFVMTIPTTNVANEYQKEIHVTETYSTTLENNTDIDIHGSIFCMLFQ